MWQNRSAGPGQSPRRAWQVGQAHYDVGNDFFAAMLDQRMTYTCGYWAGAGNLDDAQAAKLDLICRKLGLRRGMRLLDIGCGWGSLTLFAARHYGVSCVGLTISLRQAACVEQNRQGLPVEARLSDYRAFNPDGRDRTLMAWRGRFEAAWPRFAPTHGKRFGRMWRYYLLQCAGTFRARTTQLWQLVLSPQGVPRGYRRTS
jgi:cyclopropane fatty-acyl-phospholipid synthase-like methyltransferase